MTRGKNTSADYAEPKPPASSTSNNTSTATTAQEESPKKTIEERMETLEKGMNALIQYLSTQPQTQPQPTNSQQSPIQQEQNAALLQAILPMLNPPTPPQPNALEQLAMRALNQSIDMNETIKQAMVKKFIEGK